MPKTVVFDLDGTLADTSGDLIHAANAALRSMGHAPQLERGRDDAVAVRGGRRMLSLAFERLGTTGAAAEAGIQAGYPVLLEAYGQALCVHTELYTGAILAVETLKSQGYGVAICTNKPEGLAETLMQELGVRDRFDALVGADTLPVRKPDPAPLFEAAARAGGAGHAMVLIGDSETDRETARAAGVPCVLVAFGPEGDAVQDLEPEAILYSYEALPGVIAALVGD